MEHPQGVPHSIRYPEIPLYAVLENSARKYPTRAALLYYGRRISYSELWRMSQRLASSICDRGLGKGDRVALLLPNIPQFVLAYFGILSAGCVAVPVNPLNPMREIDRELCEVEARMLIALDRFLERLPEGDWELYLAEGEAYLPWHLRALSRLKRGGKRRRGNIKGFKELLASPPKRIKVEVDPKEDLAVILYTGGTTGPPKGVMHTHFSLVANALQTYHWTKGWGSSHKPYPAGWPHVVSAVPFFHSYGLTVALNEPILAGATLILVPRPTAEEIMRAIERYKATHLPATPRMIREITTHHRAEHHNLRSLICCVTGGAPLEWETAKRFRKLTGARLHHGYGLTEAGPVTHCTPVDRRPQPGSVGLPLPDTEFRLVDLETGRYDVPRGKPGELLIRGPQLMRGYWRRSEETAKALRDGWLHTGDVARVDDEGWLYILGRREDEIISSGHMVWPEEIEALLRSHPGVEEAALIGVLNPMRCATDLQALIVPKPGYEGESLIESLLALCRRRLQPFKVPSRILVVQAIPKTPLGKIDRRRLKQLIDASSRFEVGEGEGPHRE
jgi:long-chain acyl-CoA synthetase